MRISASRKSILPFDTTNRLCMTLEQASHTYTAPSDTATIRSLRLFMWETLDDIYECSDLLSAAQ